MLPFITVFPAVTSNLGSVPVIDMRALLAIAVLFCALNKCCADQLQLNTRATLFNDVESIVHNASLRQVVIELASYRRCNAPTFMVRLSGTSLYLLDFVKSNANDLASDSHSMVLFKDFEKPRPGTYLFSYPPLYDPGSYFLEVMVVYCVGMHPNDFTKLCAEDVQEGRNILTLPYTFEVTASSVASALPSPRWLLHSDFQNLSSLLPTRYQKKGCGKSGGYCPPYQVDLPQYNYYEWTDGPSYEHLLSTILPNNSFQHGKKDSLIKNDNKKEPDGDVLHFCFVGASHAEGLKDHAELLNWKNILFLWYFSKYPRSFKAQELIDMECSYAVIGYGQWMAGLSGIPYQARQYENEMKHVAAKVKWLQRTTNMQVFFRSMNYNGYGARVTACPPLDHRLPPVVDLYNSILRNVSRHAHIEYIDTNHIIGPVWDSALDYQHPRGRVYTAEVHWILHAALNYSISSNRWPTRLTCLPVAENGLVRFRGVNTIYINKKGKLHAFPNGYNYMGMGLDNVIALDTYKQKCATFGPVIRGPKDYQHTEL